MKAILKSSSITERFFLTATIAISFCLNTVGLSAYAQDTLSIDKDPVKVNAKVVKTDKDAVDADNHQPHDQSFGTLSTDGLGDGLGLNNSDNKKDGADKDAQTKTEEKAAADADAQKPASEAQPTKTASMETPQMDKAGSVQKGKAVLEDVSKDEIGVDWSHWVGALADHWYANLKNMEYRTRAVIRTARPALIRFTCYRDGHIGQVALRQSCGVPSYDQMQIEALKRCTPVQSFPEGSARMSYTLLQGWECHPRQANETDFKPGSYGQGFPTEKVPMKRKGSQGSQTAKAPVPAASKAPAANTGKTVKAAPKVAIAPKTSKQTKATR